MYTRKSIAWFLTAAAFGIGGFTLAWHHAFIVQMGGVGGLILAVLAVAAIVLAIFWPKRWKEWVRKVLFLAIIIVLVAGGWKAIQPILSNGSSWGVLIGILVVVAIVVALYRATVHDRILPQLKKSKS